MAVVEAAAWLPRVVTARALLAAAVQQQLTTGEQLRGQLLRRPFLRRRALLLATVTDVELGAHSFGELDLLRFLRQHGPPMPTQLQAPWRNGRRYLDADFDGFSLEVDGPPHREYAIWVDDLARANELVLDERAEGRFVLRFASSIFQDRPAEAADQLRRAHVLLARRRTA